MAGCDFPGGVCGCVCTLHLRATTSEGCGGTRTGSLSCQVSQMPGSLLLAGPAEAVSSLPQLKSRCVHVLRKGLQEPEWLARCPPVSCETQVISSRCCFSAFPAVESVQKSLLLVSWDSPEMENTAKVKVDLLSLPQHQADCSGNRDSCGKTSPCAAGSVLHSLWTLQLIHNGPYSKKQNLMLSSYPLSQHAQCLQQVCQAQDSPIHTLTGTLLWTGKRSALQQKAQEQDNCFNTHQI